MLINNYAALSLMNILRVFIQIHIVENIIKKVESQYKIVLLTKYYREQYTLDILYIFLHYVYCVKLRKFHINT